MRFIWKKSVIVLSTNFALVEALACRDFVDVAGGTIRVSLVSVLTSATLSSFDVLRGRVSSAALSSMNILRGRGRSASARSSSTNNAHRAAS